MILAADDPGRPVGLVYRDDVVPDGPATHALIIGVGAYRSARFKRPLTTTTVSARALADWFVDGGELGFDNPDCPLASVALLLSEPTPENEARQATYGEGPVPRADFPNVQAAVRAWVERISSHKDNLAILYVASHGESFYGSTAFLLEDFDTDPLDVTAGMCEIEQLVGALENAVPIHQLLLFDCCRTPTDARLPLVGTFGTKIINLVRREDDHGENRKQSVITSTSLGEVAIGRTNKTTLFAEALMTALAGVAGERANAKWRVQPGNLADKIALLMSLQRVAGEKAQLPNSRLAGNFPITYPRDSRDVPVYISFDDPADWPDSIISVVVKPDLTTTIVGKENEAAFRLVRVPPSTDIAVTAKNGDLDFGVIEDKIVAPAYFMQFRKKPPPRAQVIGHLDPARSLAGRAEIVIGLVGAIDIEAGAVAEIVRRDEPTKNPKQITVPIRGTAAVDVGPGEHHVTLRTPDGRVETRDVSVAKDQIVEIKFAMPDAPQDWLKAAATSGAIRAGLGRDEPVVAVPPPPPPPEMPSPWRPSLGSRIKRQAIEALGRSRILRDLLTSTTGLELPAPALPSPDDGGFMDDRGRLKTSDRLPDPIFSNSAYHVDISLERRPPSGPMIETAEWEDDGRFVRLDFVEHAHFRFEGFQEAALSRPLFALVEGVGRRELAVIPSLGLYGAETQGKWRPYILADRLAPENEALSTVVVEDTVWGGLLGFLASRDMEASGMLLSSALGTAVVDAIREKLGNPLAAIAGALVAVASANPDLEQSWDPWLTNISDWFRGISDGPIILARRKLLRARNADEITIVRQLLFEGFNRGVPIYSLSAEWLARGLESLPGEDAELQSARVAARKLIGRIDVMQAFTVIRVEQ
ncbi:Caspase domain-containing protein [Rhizobium aethiopicum]|uniref:Caspase domain-containing protein n=1 Tax=Rhizobium aethiopicum TaxID=1138170 RepID=A0A1C3Y0S5_9HYPH|nr:caspase family protein [Rhizobium aethiopicum]SCB58079.1 Caspase domain-containing protein [Rhizobium aethiopicum]